jgi:hypothetical protein
MASRVQISKGVLVGLVGVAAVALMGVVFLLGRASVRSAPMDAPKTSGGASTVSAVPPTGSTIDRPAIASPIGAAASVTQPVGPGPATAKPSSSTVSQNNSERAAVVAYFKVVESLQPESSGTPETVAQQVAAGLGKGDTSGLDGMIQQAQESRRRLSAITPPQPCAAYHRELLASLGEGLDVMQGIKKMLTSSNPSVDTSEIVNRANAMKVHADSLQSQEKALKQRYLE